MWPKKQNPAALLVHRVRRRDLAAEWVKREREPHRQKQRLAERKPPHKDFARDLTRSVFQGTSRRPNDAGPRISLKAQALAFERGPR